MRNRTIEDIKWSFSGRLIGNERMRGMVCKTLIVLPAELIEYVTNGIWFISEPDDAWAFTFRGSDIQNQHLIFLSDELFNQAGQKVKFTILHEIGHVVLGHRNSMGFRQTETEVDRQETEADEFAKKYLTVSSNK